MKEKLISLMQETKMDNNTILGAMDLLKTEEQMQQTIDYIIEYKDIITNHQLRQFLIKLTYENESR